jgi:hypothetical protein
MISFSNAGYFINNYQTTTPNLVKKEIFGNFEEALQFNYDIPHPNNQIINEINRNNEIERNQQHEALKLRESHEKTRNLQAEQYKKDFEKQMAQQKAQQLAQQLAQQK